MGAKSKARMSEGCFYGGQERRTKEPGNQEKGMKR